MEIRIREERFSDFDNIDEVTLAAFRGVAHSNDTERYIIRALRDSGSLAISLVAEDAGRLMGHVAVSKVEVSDGSKHWFGLGPISVVPNKQGKGVGSQLMVAAIDSLNRINANGCVLLGDPGYYEKFGFRCIEGLVLPNVPAEYFLAIIFRGVYPQGEVTYNESFAAKG